LYGTSIAFQLWHVHDVFSESRWLVLAIYNMLFQLVYIVLTRAFIPVNSSSYTLTRMITTFVAYMVLMNAILLPKFVELMLGTSITLHDFSRKTESPRAPPAAGVSFRVVQPDTGSGSQENSSSQDARPSSLDKRSKLESASPSTATRLRPNDLQL
jgi:hypothetical protein